MIEVLNWLSQTDADPARPTEVLEAGGLVVLPDRPFAVLEDERAFLDPALLSRKSKTVSYDAATGAVGGTALAGDARTRLAAMTARYAAFADALLAELTPAYVDAMQRGRTSFRPGPVETRVLSPRKDDRRLHVDAFPSNPVQGRRILRVFTNVDPEGRPRRWAVGEDSFAVHAARTPPSSDEPWGIAWAREKLGLTRGRRTGYDHAMLALHDGAKLDDAFQASASRRFLDFAPGTSWVVFTDATQHAALAGQHAFEQTYLLPVQAMLHPEQSPLRVLERLAGRALA